MLKRLHSVRVMLALVSVSYVPTCLSAPSESTTPSNSTDSGIQSVKIDNLESFKLITNQLGLAPQLVKDGGPLSLGSEFISASLMSNGGTPKTQISHEPNEYLSEYKKISFTWKNNNKVYTVVSGFDGSQWNAIKSDVSSSISSRPYLVTNDSRVENFSTYVSAPLATPYNDFFFSLGSPIASVRTVSSTVPGTTICFTADGYQGHGPNDLLIRVIGQGFIGYTFGGQVTCEITYQ